MTTMSNCYGENHYCPVNADIKISDRLNPHRFGSLESQGTWCADIRNKTHGKYFPVRSAAAPLGNRSCVALPPASMQSCGRWSCFGYLHTMPSPQKAIKVVKGTAVGENSKFNMV